jgi:hypothetical protein
VSENVDKKPENRWWEFYFVRYFVGTALGAIIVLFLAMSESPAFTSQGEVATILKSLKPDKFESGYIAVLATIGLTFCYLASSPILVLHATRGSLLEIRAHSNWRLISCFVGLILIVAGLQSWALWDVLLIKGNPWKSHDFYVGSILLLFVSVIFIGQLFLLWLSLSNREKNAFEYYDNLVKKRADANEAGKEYIESYRHLREHGNAFFIALLELLLGATLFYSPAPWAVLLILWIFPAAGVWFFGTLLENRNF